MGKLDLDEYDRLINEVCNNGDVVSARIAEKYNLSQARVSQIRKRVRGLRYAPKIENGKVQCHLCGSEKFLVFRHDHATGEYIAIVCRKCNQTHRNWETVDATKYEKAVIEVINFFKSCIEQPFGMDFALFAQKQDIINVVEDLEEKMGGK